MWSPPFPASLPPHHLRRSLPDASTSAGSNSSSSLMDLRSKRRPASFALPATSAADDALRKKLFSSTIFPSSRPPRHPRLVLGASISAGLDPSSSSMALRSRRRPASFALFVTFIVDDALRKIYLRPGIYSSSRLPFPSSSSSLHPRRRHALGIGAAPSSSCKKKNILLVYREG